MPPSYPPRPNLFLNPALALPYPTFQPAALESSPQWGGPYRSGDCVKWKGENYMFIADSYEQSYFPQPSANFIYPRDPDTSFLTPTSNGLYSPDGGGLGAINLTGAMWIKFNNPPVIPPFSIYGEYKLGDLVTFPDPTVVWRANGPTTAPPNVPGRNTNLLPGVLDSKGFDEPIIYPQPGLNNLWSLISSPVQTTAFNPLIPYIPGYGGSGPGVSAGGPESLQPLPLPSFRPAPM